MPELFMRRARLSILFEETRTNSNVAGSEVILDHFIDPNGVEQGLDFAFSVTRTNKKEPNTAQISVVNMSPDQIALIQQKRTQAIAKNIAKRKHNAAVRAGILEDDVLGGPKSKTHILVKLEAGYANHLTQIFAGDLTEAHSVVQGADIVTQIDAQDGGHAYRSLRTNQAFGRGASVPNVVSFLLDKLAASGLLIGRGFLQEVVPTLQLEDIGDTFRKGIVLSGRTIDLLDKVLRSCGYKMSIQGTVLQVHKRKESLDNDPIVLSKETGLLSAPIKSSDGIVSAHCLIIPDLYPGRRVSFVPVGTESFEQIEGNYRVDKAQYSGATSEQDWYADVECQEI